MNKNFEIKIPFYICLLTGIFTWLIIIITVSYTYHYSPHKNYYFYFTRSLINWDAIWYIKIAIEGYSVDRMVVFFPLLPLLIKIFHFIIKDYVWSGLLISNVSRIIAAIFFYNLIKTEYNKEIASKSLILWSISPANIFFVNIYTESLFFMLCCLFFYFLKDKNFLLAAIVAGFISSTKNIGFFISIIFIFEYIRICVVNKKFNIFRIMFLSFISFSGLIFYSLFLKIKYNDPIYFLNAQELWHFRHNFSYPFYALFNSIVNIKSYFSTTINEKKTIFSFLYTLLSIFFAFYGFKKIKFFHYLFFILIIITLSFQPTLMSNFRYFSGIFTFWVIAAIIFNRYIKTKLLILTVCFILLITQIYVILRWFAGLWVA